MDYKRQHDRFPFDSEIQIVVAGQTRSGRTVNLSPGGANVALSDPLEFGTEVELIIKLPGIDEPCHIDCVVRWVHAGESVGLQFQHLRAIETWALNRLKTLNLK